MAPSDDQPTNAEKQQLASSASQLSGNQSASTASEANAIPELPSRNDQIGLPEGAQPPPTQPQNPTNPVAPPTTPPNTPSGAQDAMYPMGPTTNTPKQTNKLKLIVIGIIALIVILIIGFVAFFFLRGGSTAGEKGPVVMWGFEDAISWRPIIEQYEQEYKKEVEYTQVSRDGYELALLDAMVSEKAPDIFPLWSDWYYKHQDKVQPTAEYTWLPELYPYAKELLIQDSQNRGQNMLYGIPLSADNLALFYNKDLVPNITHDDLRYWDLVQEWAGRNTTRPAGNIDTGAIALGSGSNVTHGADILSLIMLQNGTPMTNEDGTMATYDKTIDKAAVGAFSPGKETLEYFTSFSNKGAQSYSWNSAMPSSIEAFATGKTRLYLGYARDIDALKNRNTLLNYGILPAPQIRNSEKEINMSKFVALSVYRASPRSQSAWQLLELIAKGENITQLNKAHNTPSPYKTIASGNEQMSFFEAQADTASDWQKFDQLTADEQLLLAVNNVVERGERPQDAIAKAALATNEYIKDKLELRKTFGIELSDEVRAQQVYIWTIIKDEGLKDALLQHAKNKKLPYNKVSDAVIPLDKLERTYLEEVASRRVPDLVHIPQSWLPDWYERISPIAEDSGSIEFVKNNFIQDAQKNIKDDKLWGVPVYKNILGLVYNWDVLNVEKRVKIPESWDELTAQIPTLTIKDAQGNITRSAVTLGTADNVTNAPDLLMAMMLQYGAKQTNTDDSQVTFHLPISSEKSADPAGDALAFYKSFADPSTPNYTWNSAMPRDLQAFIEQKTVYTFAYWRDLGELSRTRTDFRYAFAPLPQISYQAEPVDMVANDVVVVPRLAFKKNVVIDAIAATIVNMHRYAGINKWPTPFVSGQKRVRNQVRNPFGILGDTSYSLYSKGDPQFYSSVLRQLIREEITIKQAGDTINENWRQND